MQIGLGPAAAPPHTGRYEGSRLQAELLPQETSKTETHSGLGSSFRTRSTFFCLLLPLASLISFRVVVTDDRRPTGKGSTPRKMEFSNPISTLFAIANFWR